MKRLDYCITYEVPSIQYRNCTEVRQVWADDEKNANEIIAILKKAEIDPESIYVYIEE